MAVDIILGTIIAALVILIVVNGIRKVKKGDAGCGCGCDGCHVDACESKK